MASIHSSSLPLALASALLLLGGGWKATFRPSCRGSCFANASRRALGSREKGTVGFGPTEPRGGTVIDIERVGGLGGAGGGTAGIVGDGPLGRLLRFSVLGGQSPIEFEREWLRILPGGIASEALRSAIRTEIRSSTSSTAL